MAGYTRFFRDLHSYNGLLAPELRGPDRRIRATISPVASFDPQRLDTEALYDYAVRTLVRRSLTVNELRERLVRRASRSPDVDAVIGRLRRANYLDDARLAESYAHFRRDYEGLGRQRVLRELSRRGVDKKVARKAVAESYTDSDEPELIRRFLERKVPQATPSTPINDRKQLVRLYRALIRAGFSSARIVEALRELSSDSDWLEAFAEAQHPEDEEAFD